MPMRHFRARAYLLCPSGLSPTALHWAETVAGMGTPLPAILLCILRWWKSATLSSSSENASLDYESLDQKDDDGQHPPKAIERSFD